MVKIGKKNRGTKVILQNCKLVKLLENEEQKICCFYRISGKDEAFFGTGIIDSELGWKLCWSNGKIELIEMYD